MSCNFKKQKIRSFFFLVLLTQFLSVHCEKKVLIIGSTKLVLNGKVVLWRIGPSEFYSSVFENDTATLKNGYFSFTGIKDDYPEQFRFKIIDSTNKNYFSAPFFLDTGCQEILIKNSRSLFDYKLSGYLVQSSSHTGIEYQFFLQQFDSINNIYDQFFQQRDQCYLLKDSSLQNICLKNLQKQRNDILRNRDSILLSYAQKKRNANILSWHFYDFLKTFGYNKFYQLTFNISSPYIKPQNAIYLNELLMREKMKSVGSQLPFLDNIKQQLPDFVIENNEYTLIDFWFSSCTPCIAQFSKFRTLYDKYNKHGFIIVGISRDDNLDDWKAAIAKHQLPWLQIWDKDNFLITKLDVLKYPSNFLLDSKGQILFKDIGINDLHFFLENKLCSNN